MPIISISRTDLNPLGPASTPVLDRQQRPTVNLSGVAQAAGQLGQAGAMPMVDAGAFVGADRALGAIGQAVAQSGGILEAAALKRAEAQNHVDIADADARLEAEQADFESWKQSHPDPRDWQAEWNTRSQRALGAVVSNKKLSADARAAIELRAKSWQSRSGIMIARDATKETFNRAKSASLAAMDRAAFSGDEQGFTAAKETALTSGYIYEHEGEAASQRFTMEQERKVKQAQADAREADWNRLTMGTMENPFTMDEPLSATDENGRNTYFPNLDATDLVRAKAQVKAAQNARRADTFEMLQDRIVSGAASEAEIREMGSVVALGEKNINDLLQYRVRMAEQKASDLPMDEDASLELSAKIEKFKPEEMDEATALDAWVRLKAEADLITARGGDVGRLTRGVYNQRLEQLHPLHDRRKPTANLPEGVESDFNDLMKTYAPAVSTEALKTDADREKAKAEQRVFIMQRSRLFSDLEKEMKANPNLIDPMKGGLDGWIAGKWKGVRAASRLPVAEEGGSAALFPQGSVDPNEAFKSILK